MDDRYLFTYLLLFVKTSHYSPSQARVTASSAIVTKQHYTGVASLTITNYNQWLRIVCKLNHQLHIVRDSGIRRQGRCRPQTSSQTSLCTASN
ncbi:hypothetical protein E2C01_093029 [Portunus trituberculatus]|uniref:Uncharacterized protein n=1 Tax=Portunus trituberculatus TaxID=210409 RepID=A0A5B7JTG1_PORTR|nr:hypothetical protein [Portunus trituberculatus]